MGYQKHQGLFLLSFYQKGEGLPVEGYLIGMYGTIVMLVKVTGLLECLGLHDTPVGGGGWRIQHCVSDGSAEDVSRQYPCLT